MARIQRTITALALAIGVSGATVAAQQSVNWTAQSNVNIRGGSLEKVNGCDGCDDAGALSRQVIRAGNGFVEFRVDDPYASWTAGLSRGGRTPHSQDIDFAWRFNGNGWADVMERGAYQTNSDTQVNEGDVFQVALESGRVQYIRNGEIIHESSQRPSYPLAFAAALGSLGSRILDARIETSGRAIATSGYDSFDRYDSRSFADLDRNRNGFVNRAEWNGAARDFDRLDLNGDNRITRAEWAQAEFMGSSAVGTTGAAGRNGEQIVIDSREQWTPTGIRVQAGDYVTFDASGSVELSRNGNDFGTPEGATRRIDNGLIRGEAAGVLVGRIGISTPFIIGSHRTMRAQTSGELFLGVNDDYFLDNVGEYRVNISLDSNR